MDPLIWLLLGVVGFSALIYIVGPVMVWLQVRSSMDPDVRIVETDDVPPAALDLDREAEPALRALGFEPRGWIAIHGFMRGQIWHLRAWANAASLDMASTNHVRQQAGATATEQTIVSFSTVFDGGRMVSTGNATEPPPFPWKTPDLEEWVVPGEQSLERLHALHQGAVSVFGQGRMKNLPSPGTEERAIHDMILQQLRMRVDAGYFSGDERAREFRPTVLGAIKMTWSLLPPFKQLRLNAMRRHIQMLPAVRPIPAREPVAT